MNSRSASWRRTVPPLREPMPERLVWALGLAVFTLLGLTVVVNVPGPAGIIFGGVLLAPVPAGIAYRRKRCDMFARRAVRVAGGSARPGLLILWGWAFWLLLALPGWSFGTFPDPIYALMGACAVGVLVLDEWRGLLLLGGFAISLLGAGLVLAKAAPAFGSTVWFTLLLPLAMWFAAVWISEMLRKPD